MRPIAVSIVLWAALCAGALGDTAVDRPLEDCIAISPVILTGQIAKEGKEFKHEGTTYREHEVKAATILRSPAKGPQKGSTVTVYDTAKYKVGAELVMLLGQKDPHGHRMYFSAKPDGLKRVQSLLALQARAAKELDGKEKVPAALFRAHQLRPKLLAKVQGKYVRPSGEIPQKEKDKLLAILGGALAESAQKGAKPEARQLAESLLAALSGPGGLPEIKTRRERIAQFWSAQLKNAAARAKYKLAKLAITDKPVKVAVPIRRVGQQVLVIRPGVRVQHPQKATKPAKPKPKPAAFDEASVGKAVGGLAVAFSIEKPAYNLVQDPDQGVTVRATFRNTGERAFRLNTYLVFPALVKVFIVDPRGKLSIYTDRSRLGAAELPAMGTWSFKELKPGASLHFTETIPPSRFSQHGVYKLCVIYKNTYGKQFGIAGAWTGEVVSERVPVKIIRRPDPKPKRPPEAAPKREPVAGLAPKPEPAARPPVIHRRIQIQAGQGAQQILRVEVHAGNGAVEQRVIVNGKEVKAKEEK